MNVSRPRVHTTQKSVIYNRTEIVNTGVDTPNGSYVNKFNIRARYRINPGSARTFPWLSNIAKCYESYRFKKLSFHYITRANTTREGVLYLSPDYDAADTVSENETVVANNSDTKEGSLFKNLSVFLKPEKMNRLYKAHTCMDDARFDTSAQDEKTIDCAQLIIAMETDVMSVRVGKLMVEYEVELFEPQQPFIPLAQGGAIATGLTLNANSATTFASAPLLNNGVVNQPLLTQDGITYPSSNMGKFTRDFQGFLTNFAVSNSNITSLPPVMLNGNNVVSSFFTNANQLVTGTSTYLNAKAGDTIGIGPVVTAGALQGLTSVLGGTGFLN
jgi:hypothetical protein